MKNHETKHAAEIRDEILAHHFGQTASERATSKPAGQPRSLAVATGSGQLTKGARHYGITTKAAGDHLQEMLAEDRKFPDGTPDVWTDLTGFDRACIRELLAWSREHGLESVSPNTPGMSHGHSANNSMDTIANQPSEHQGAAVDVGSGPLFGDGCEHCDSFGGQKTYANQACLPLNGRVVCIDWCIHQIVAALNAGGVRTTACCCGHGRMLGRIDLEDGRILTITSPNPGDEPRPAQQNETRTS